MRHDPSRALFVDADAFRVDWGAPDIERRIPHRPPMRLLDAVIAMDVHGLRAVGLRRVDPEDPVLAGHFPGNPIYPGVLQLELIGQLGLCLAWERARVDVGAEPDAMDARVVRIQDARFTAAVRPGDSLRVVAAVVDHDALLGRIVGQTWVGDRLCATAELEVYFA